MKTTCKKCSYNSEENLERFGVPLCSVCMRFAPTNLENFEKYIKEKIDGDLLNTFRKFSEGGRPQKNSMIEKAKDGNLMSRAPFGYRIENKKLVPAENFRDIEKLFEEFLNKDVSLTSLAKKYNLSVNGLKKVLKNFTYVGKIKFNGQIHDGSHKAIISSTLFNHVQNKLEELGIK